MKVKKIILLKDSKVNLVYEDGFECIRKARGILMKPWGIQATLEDRKTQTRRVMTGLKEGPGGWFIYRKLKHKVWIGDLHFLSNYKPGDLLYIKESYKLGEHYNVYLYKIDINEKEVKYINWKSPLFMPREVARYWLEIVSVSVERIQDIMEEDAKAEGVSKALWHVIDGHDDEHLGGSLVDHKLCYKNGFANEWDEINANRKDKAGNIFPYSWNDNPVVTVLEYKHIFTGRGENGKDR